MSDQRQQRSMAVFEPLKIFQFPFFLENFLAIVLFSFMFLIAIIYATLPRGMGLRSIATWVVLLTIFFNYSFVIVDYTSRGLQRVPKLSGELVFPTHDSRLYTITLLTLLFAFFLFTDRISLASEIRIVASFFAYPLLFALLVAHVPLKSLFNPFALARSLVIFSASWPSLIFYVLQLATVSLIIYVFMTIGPDTRLHVFWQVPLTITLLFILFRCMGAVLNEQGPALGMPVLMNSDLSKAARQRVADIELSDFLMKLHRWTRVHEYKKAMSEIEAYQRQFGHAADEAMLDRLLAWDDRRLAGMLAAILAESEMRRGNQDKAFDHFRTGFDASHRFSFSSGTVLLQFTEHAKDIETRQRLFEILKDFDSSYPNHPNTETALMTAAEIALDNLKDIQKARSILIKMHAAIDDMNQQDKFDGLCERVNLKL